MENELDLRRYFVVARRWLWLIVGCAVLAGGSAFAINSRVTPVYSASVTLLVQSPSLMSNYSDIYTTRELARTYAQMVNKRPVLEAVVAQLGLDEPWGSLAGRVSAETIQDTQMIQLSVRDTDPVRAARLADAVANAFIAQNDARQQERYADYLTGVQQQIDELSVLIAETQAKIDALDAPEMAQEQAEAARLESILAGYRNTYAILLQAHEQMRLTAAQSANNVIVLEAAEVPAGPIGPNTMRSTLLAGLVGAMLAAGVAFLVEYLDDTIKTPEDISRALGLNTVGAIGRLRRGAEELVTVTQPLAPVSEAFRALRTNIRFSSVDDPLRTILVTSAGPTEGKSVTVANLAAAMAQAGLKAVAVDADLRRPRLHQMFGLHPQGGLTTSLLEGNTDGRLQPIEQVEGLAVLPAGELPPNPAELLGSRRMHELLDLLKEHVDVVVIDSPPVLPVTDAAVLAQEVDGVLLVVDARQTRRGAAKRAVESLRQVGANLVGVVLNAVPTNRGGYYYYYY